MAWADIVGQRYSPEEFDRYVNNLTFGPWRPAFVVVHNTATPSLTQRPAGFTRAHIDGLVTYYRDQKGWSAGPHVFVDQNGLWVFTPLTARGVHSPSWNDVAWGVETLGDYAKDVFEEPIRGHLLSCLESLHAVLNLDPRGLRFHKEDPQTTHTGCPGKNLSKADLLSALVERLSERQSSPALPIA